MFMTTQEVADRFRTKAATVRWWRHMGRGPDSFRVGRKVLYPIESVEAWERAAIEEAHRDRLLRGGDGT
jgi:hypothetical protein